MNKNHFSTFKDPQGRLVKLENKIFRFLNSNYIKEINLMLSSNIIKKLIQDNKIISYKLLEKKNIKKLTNSEIFKKHYSHLDYSSILEHKLIDFVNYPYEWSSSMLFDAGMLTLDLFEKLLSDNIGLKDANPFNIIFENFNPIFVDLLSFEKRNSNDHIWLAYSQFNSMFLIPLYLNKYFDISLDQIFLTNFNGIEPSECRKKIKLFNKLSYFLILIPNFLSRYAKSEIYHPSNTKNPELALFILKRVIKKLKKRLLKLKINEKKSKWSDYMKNLTHYKDIEFQKKQKFISKILDENSYKKILDIGCNTGYFSILAAKKNINVTAIDLDAEVVDRVYKISKKLKLKILPLVMNICHPTPSTGWNNQINTSFLQRCHKHFDMLFMLALIHHMQITERVPIEEIALLANSLTTKDLIIEYIDPKDPMFIKLCKGRDYLYYDYNEEKFKKTFEKNFSIKEFIKTNNTRTLYFMSKNEK